jgi:hypothetical protein
MLHHGIQNDEAFMHAGGNGHYKGFARLAEALIKGADHRIEAGGRSRRHLQRIADLFASAPDAAFAFELAAITVKRRDADQRRNGLAIKDP